MVFNVEKQEPERWPREENIKIILWLSMKDSKTPYTLSWARILSFIEYHLFLWLYFGSEMTDRRRELWPSFKKNFQIDWKANKGIMCLNVSLVLGLSEANKVQRLRLRPKPHRKSRECLVHYKNETIDWRNMQKYGKDFYGLSSTRSP